MGAQLVYLSLYVSHGGVVRAMVDATSPVPQHKKLIR